VHLELQQMKYSSVTQLVAGSQTPKNQVEYQTIDQQEITSTTSAQAVTLTPKLPGAYRLR